MYKITTEQVTYQYLIEKGLSKEQIKMAVKKNLLTVTNKRRSHKKITYDVSPAYLKKFKELFAVNVMTLETLQSYGIPFSEIASETQKGNLIMSFICKRYVFEIDKSPFIKEVLNKQKDS
ncbi:hypothetical protein LNJ08_08615 [Tenacibaculum finnmarkense genomovar ulcerans]|uniref:hypothetical protein n=1 Tax=Tenacibaculum finnmarkense TaxID=2781243 RepID=UPI001E585C74|nr:hypothetical protein [Tenacibaculum finnmarkense]MCD8454459.1 hypothetical protein [Tenacibaculum finnmarkense genomovar ulcerans]